MLRPRLDRRFASSPPPASHREPWQPNRRQQEAWAESLREGGRAGGHYRHHHLSGLSVSAAQAGARSVGRRKSSPVQMSSPETRRSHRKRDLSPKIAEGKVSEIAPAKNLLVSIFEVRDAAECRAFGGIIRVGDKTWE